MTCFSPFNRSWVKETETHIIDDQKQVMAELNSVKYDFHAPLVGSHDPVHSVPPEKVLHHVLSLNIRD